MRIIFICPEFKGFGGTEKVLAKVAQHEIDIGNEVQIVLTARPISNDWLGHLRQVATITQPKHNGKVFKSWLLILSMIHIPNDALVIVLGANLVSICAKFRRHFHRHWTIVSWIHFSFSHQHFFDPHRVLAADKHLVISSNIKNSLIKMGVPTKDIFLVYNPVDNYHGQLNVPLDNHHGINIAFVGRTSFNGQKNLHFLMDAVHQIKLMGQQITLFVYGTGPDLNKTKNYVNHLGISSSVIWKGFRKNVWDDLINNVHPQALVLTSKFEGLPMVMLEAMTRGIPCVTSQFEGYADVLNEGVNGYSYPMGDQAKFVTELKSISQNKLLPDKIQNSIGQFRQATYFKHFDTSLRKCMK